MSAYLIIYDLCKPGQSYDGFYEALESFKNAQISESAYVITSDMSAQEISRPLWFQGSPEGQKFLDRHLPK